MDVLVSHTRSVKVLRLGPNASPTVIVAAQDLISAYRGPLFGSTTSIKSAPINIELARLGLLLKLEGIGKLRHNERESINYQFNWLSEAFFITPETVPAVLMLVQVGDKRAYVMERIVGRTLSSNWIEIGCELKGEPGAIVGPLKDAVRKLHERGMPHGDIVEGFNVLIREGGTSRAVLIDPLRISADRTDHLAHYVRRDFDGIASIEGMLRKAPDLARYRKVVP